MTDTRRKDPTLKSIARSGYRALTGARALAFAKPTVAGDTPRVFYSGARSGDTGGPLVKVQRLQQAFPQSMGMFNLIYSLSNTPYLSRNILERLKARGTRIVHNQNGVFYPGWYDGDWEAENTRMSHAYHLADHVFWQSAFCRACADQFLGIRDGGGEVLFNAVDIAHFAPRENSKTNGPFTFLLTGKLQSHLAYRLEDSIAGLAHVRAAGLDAILTIAGRLDAGATDAALATAQKYGLGSQVRLLGPYSQIRAPSVYRAADAYVMTKHADPCPNTVIEAMACGLPVAFVASGGVPELVGKDAGAGVEANNNWERPFRPNPEALGAAMLSVAEHHKLMSSAARRRAETNFNLDTWLNRHTKIFRATSAETS